jgi:hypothetical protein
MSQGWDLRALQGVHAVSLFAQDFTASICTRVSHQPCTAVTRASAGQTSAEKDPGDGTVKPIPQRVISDCVKRWTAANKQRVPAWAYDGRNNLYSPQVPPFVRAVAPF